MAWATDRWTLRIWATVLEAGGHQLPHLHPLGWLSGVYYVQVPTAMTAPDGAAGALEFGKPPPRVLHSTEPERRAVVPGAGHAAFEPGIRSQLIAVTNRFRDKEKI